MKRHAFRSSALARIRLPRARSAVRRHRICSVDRVGHLKSVHMTKATRHSRACGASGGIADRWPSLLVATAAEDRLRSEAGGGYDMEAKPKAIQAAAEAYISDKG